MSLNLDTRQRAMLMEMGAGAWLSELGKGPPTPDENALTQGTPSLAPPYAMPVTPRADAPAMNAEKRERIAASQASQTQTAPALTAAPVAPLASHASQPATWGALCEAVASCQACPMCQGRQAPVMAPMRSAPRADWMVLGEPPDDEQERAGMPFAGEAGDLLDKMLKAVGVQRLDDDSVSADPSSRAYLSLVLKCRPAVPVTPDDRAVQACEQHLQHEIALVQPKVILAMGRIAMRLLLSETQPQGLRLPLAKLRGRAWQYRGVPVVVTYPPAYLLRNAHDKAKAWEDLKLARELVARVSP